MFTWLIRGLLGLFGIVNPVLKYTPSNYSDFRKKLMPGALVLVRSCNPDGTTPAGLSNAIETASSSAWAHSENYFGQSSGKHNIPGETIGALAEGVKAHSLDEYGTPGFQMIAFNFDLDARTFSILRDRLYSKENEDYDDWKIANFATPIIPDFGNGITCSTLCAMARMGHAQWSWDFLFSVLKKGILPENATPGDLYNGCYPQVAVEVLRYNC
jgi:hypothetical protein